MKFRVVLSVAIVGAVLSVLERDAVAGTLTITQRVSSAGNELFAGSGGAVDSRDESDSTTALTGSFSFSDSGAVEVLESDPFSNGSASASGSITAFDSVSQPAPGKLTITATHSANGIASYGSGTGNAQSYQSRELRVRFTVDTDNAIYSLTGDFDPGVITTVVGEAHTLQLYRPFTADLLVDVDSAATLNESGLLLAGKIYELRVRVNDRNRANSGTPASSDVSSFSLQFNVQSVPEPSSALLAASGCLLLLVWRTRRRAA